MNAGLVPTMPDGLPDPQPVAGDIDPLLRLMRENQQLTAELKAACEKIVQQKKIYEELRIHAGQQLEAFGQRVTLAEQGRRRTCGQATTLARCLNRLHAAVLARWVHDYEVKDVIELGEAMEWTRELLAVVPPEMK